MRRHPPGSTQLTTDYSSHRPARPSQVLSSDRAPAWGPVLLFRFEGATRPRRAAATRSQRSRVGAPRPQPFLRLGRRPAGGLDCRHPHLENSIASTSIFDFQATKSQRWMPWRLEPMKDVGDCEKLRGAVDRASIRRCPNGETRHPSWGATLA